MVFFDELTLGSVPSSVLISVGCIVAAPLLLPVVGAGVRPVVWRAIQGGIAAYDAAAALVTTAGEARTQLVAEARAATTPAPESDTMPPLDEMAPHIIRPEGASA
jgi:hypothetical protein